MNVTHFSTFTYGGAATAAERIHEGLLACDINSRFVHGSDPLSLTDDPTYSALQVKPPTENRLLKQISLNLRRMQTRRARHDYRNHLADRPEEFEAFSSARQFEPTSFDFAKLDSDIINLHWVSFFIDYASFFRSIPRETPIVWTLHDMNAFTGGCHYAAGCDRFRLGCGNCQQVANPCADDVSADSFRVKQQALAGRPIHIVTPSRWLNKLAKQSPIFPAKTTFRVIPYGLNTTAFSPLIKEEAKRQLGIAPDSRVILFGAEQLTNRRKGFSFLLDALKKLPKNDRTVCLFFGDGDLTAYADQLPTTHQTGYLKSDSQKRLVYSAADCFVMPSLEDNQPQTGLEAMACGTPVVAFSAGGIPEYVIDGETGLLAPVADSDALAIQIQRLIENRSLVKKLGGNARRMIERDHDLKQQGREYVEHYRQVTGLKPRRSLLQTA